MLNSMRAWLCLAKTAAVLGLTSTTLASVTMAVIMAEYKFFQGLGGARKAEEALVR